MASITVFYYLLFFFITSSFKKELISVHLLSEGRGRSTVQRFLKSPGSRRGAVSRTTSPEAGIVFVLLHLTAQGAQDVSASPWQEGAGMRAGAGAEAGAVTKADAFTLWEAPARAHPPLPRLGSLHPYFHLNQGSCWVSA